METTKRTIVKAILWQITGVFTMGVVGFLMTSSFSQGLALALANTAVGTVTYIIYERVWSRILWERD